MEENKQVEIVEIFSRCFIIQVSEFLNNEQRTQSFTVNLKHHAKQRLDERKIRKEEVAAAILYGYSTCKQGECFHALTQDMVPVGSGLETRGSDGLVVICDESSGVVKTCFRKKDPVQYVKKKRQYRMTETQVIKMKLRHRFKNGPAEIYELHPEILAGRMSG